MKNLIQKIKLLFKMQSRFTQSDLLWIEYLLGKKIAPQKLKTILPSMPSEKVQLHFTGAKDETSLHQAMDFYKIAKHILTKNDIKSLKNKYLLDFGCGWGRIIRMWIRDIPGQNIYGVDPMMDIIDLCKETIPNVNFICIDPNPPITLLGKNKFDIITGYSVFSHLNQQYVDKWLIEFSRIIKKNGFLFLTTRSRNFLTHLNILRENNNFADYEKGLIDCFTETEELFIEYDNGKIIHQPIGGGSLSNSFYGETCIPLSYFSKFSNLFEIIEFIPELTFEKNQALVILKKK